MAIEVEKKFKLTPEAEVAVRDGAVAQHRKQVEDTYYDDPTWRISRADTFLRQRNGAWELKVGDPTLPPHGQRTINTYEEIEDEAEIARRLELGDGPLAAAVEASDLVPFATITTDRESLAKDGFTIVVDHVTYQAGDTYNIIEIELMDETPEVAEQRISDFAKSLGLPDEPVLGKLQEFCERHRPDHIIAMKEAGQIV